VFDFSHEEMKRTVVGFKVFVMPYLTMSASSCTINNEYMIKRKKEKKKKPTKSSDLDATI